MERKKESGEAVQFSEIFFKPEFNSNDTVSEYMLLDKVVKAGIGTVLVTYGYSGVGKSFTLFGAPESRKPKREAIPGLLQSTITNITDGLVSVNLRVYELYGMGLGYSDLWKDYRKIDHMICHYNVKLDGDKKLALHDIIVNPVNANVLNPEILDMSKYIDNIKSILWNKWIYQNIYI